MAPVRTVSGLAVAGALVASLTGSCGLIATVPDESKGDTPLQVSNWLNAKICKFAMTPRGAAKRSVNWLGSIGIEPAHTQSFDIKPGDYFLEVGGCDSLLAPDFHGETPIRIAGPTFISVGPPQIGAPAGYARMQLNVVGAVGYYSSYSGGGEAASSEPSEVEPSGSSESAESSEGTSEEPSGAAGDANPNCRPSGATCDQSYQCCSGACVTHSPDDYCR